MFSKKWNIKQKRLFAAALFLLLVIVSAVFLLWPHDQGAVGQIPCPNGKCSEVKLQKQHEDRLALLKENRQINDEFLGIITIGSLIEEEVVQSQDNEKYLNLSFDKKEDSKGAVFMDYRNQLNDQNLIFYGHYVYKDESAMFSPLHQLTEKENYKKNRFITLDMESEVRIYEIAYVYYYEMGNKDLEYFHPNYADKLDGYLASIQEKAFYKTNVKITNEDRFLTLQTCVRDRDDLRLIVIAKMVSQ